MLQQRKDAVQLDKLRRFGCLVDAARIDERFLMVHHSLPVKGSCPVMSNWFVCNNALKDDCSLATEQCS